jgi:hypothetical protein
MRWTTKSVDVAPPKFGECQVRGNACGAFTSLKFGPAGKIQVSTDQPHVVVGKCLTGEANKKTARDSW